MRQIKSYLRFSSAFTFLVLLGTASTFAQVRTTWSTAADIRSGARGAMVGSVSDIGSNSFTLVPDRDRLGTTVRVTTNTVATRFLGYGDRNASEVFSGTAGFARMRIGDRVEVRGIGDTRNTIAAEEVALLGRSVTATTTEGALSRTGTVEGVVRSIRAEDNRIVIETDRREMVTILGSASTPVYYQGEAYRIRNIEVGDRIRVDIESSTSTGIRARLIDVVRDATPDDGRPSRTVTSIFGRVNRIDSRASSFRLQTDRGEVLVDARSANDRAGDRFRVSDLQVGDQLEVTGQFDTLDNFRADTIRFSSEFDREDRIDDNIEDDRFDNGYAAVNVTGTLTEELVDNMIIVRESSGDRIRVLVDKDFVVRNRAGAYIRASQLKEGDRVEVRAFRDRSGRHIAQTIRIR